MKSIYWQPRKVTLRALIVICLLALAGVLAAEVCRSNAIGPVAQTPKLRAAQLAQQAMQTIREERLRRGHTFNPEYDPAQSGMIGEYLTPITSVSGHLESKQTSVNPNFAAAIVDMLQQAGVKQGDVVAVGYSGSFPTLNLCVCCALETLGARPVVIASAAASQFGANRPDLLWIDMEQLLHDRGLISFRSVAASLGGYEDRAVGTTDEGRQLLREGIRRNQLPLLENESFAESIDERLQIYQREAAGRPIKAYINVGGGTISVGRSVGKKLYEPGLNLTATPEAMRIDSVITRFARQQVPIIHLVEVTKIAKAHHLPFSPAVTPAAGEGPLFNETRLHRWLAAGMLLLLGVSLYRVSRRPAEEKETLPVLTLHKETPLDRAA